MTSSNILWETLARKERDVVRTTELEEMARTLEKNPRHAIDHLVRAGRLEPLFNGAYYVKKPDEVMLNVHHKSALEIFALAAEARGIGRWYFGLHSALRLHAMTHEYSPVHHVVSERIYRINGIDIAGTKFVIHKWTPSLFEFGLTKVSGLPVSDPARTVLDLAYLDYWRHRHGGAPTGLWREYVNRVDPGTFRSYVDRAPPPLREWVRPWI